MRERKQLRRTRQVQGIFLVTGVAILVMALYSFCVGKYPMSLAELRCLLAGQPVGRMTEQVFFYLRIPRTIMAVLGGAGLGLAGSVYQTIFKNPLASPDIIGISSGANLGAAIAIVAVSGGMMSVASGAFASTKNVFVMSFFEIVISQNDASPLFRRI